MKNKSLSYDTQELRDFAEVLRGRRSIGLFLQTSVPSELLAQAIEVATWAPNHHLTQPWHFYDLGKQAVARCLDLCCDIVTTNSGEKAGEFKRAQWSGKPGWLVVSCRRSNDTFRQQEDYAACCAAVQNLMLFLWKAGVGCKWCTGEIIRDDRFSQIIGLDQADAFVVALIWYGYPKLTPAQSRLGPGDVLTSCD